MGPARVVATSLRGADEVPLPSGVDGGEAGIGPDDCEARGPKAGVDRPEDPGEVPEAAGLDDGGAAAAEDAPDVRVEFSRVEGRAGTDGVGGVDDDEVVPLGLAGLDELRGVVVDHRESVVVGRPDRRKERPARGDDLRVDLHEIHLANGLVLQRLPRDAAVAAADHEHAEAALSSEAEGAAPQQRNVRQKFVVPALVPLGALEGPVQHQSPTEGRRLHDGDPLERALGVVEHLLDLRAPHDPS
mmetsp:Transcript_16069/g.52318  ORF Transcript_16069/g.52318 Transcript_16069/m.52318 type:complete len:244 (-) Transcript_16069:149-880(-)